MKTILLILLACFTICCSNNHKFKHISNSDSLIKSEQMLFIDMYKKFPSFYPGGFVLDTNKKHSYFYYVFDKKTVIEDCWDSIKYTLYTGASWNTGKGYSIVVIDYNNEKFAIPFDIEEGKKTKYLDIAFTEIYKILKSNHYTSKKERIVLIIDKILRNTQMFQNIYNEDEIKFLAKYRIKEMGRNTPKNVNLVKKGVNEFSNIFKSINDSLFVFNKDRSYLYNSESAKYIVYKDKFLQVFIVSITDNEIKFRFLNPLNSFHLYI